MTLRIKALFVCAGLALCASSLAADAPQDNGEDSGPSYADIVSASEHMEGLFDLYRNPDTGEVHIGIDADQVGQEFIYFVMTEDGPVEGGHFRGYFRDNAVVSIRRHFGRIEFVKENTSFYFDPDNAVSRAADANISPAILAVQDIVAEDEESGRILIKADDVFLSESLHQVKATPGPDHDPKKAFTLGELNSSKNKIFDIRNYPENTDVFVEYVYENPSPAVQAEEAITDSRYVSIRVQHTFIRMPENGYTPRFDDPRVGYFTDRVTDLTSGSHTPYRDLVRRWNLVKKDPQAEISEPVEPIVWWIENTTPVEFRDLITKAALAWNSSFEKAGFKNAVQVRVQPDDADWDAGDIRYNVLRWTSSPQPPFGGYGPSFTNPRTGQIIGADIMLEYSFITRRVRSAQLWETIRNGGVPEGIDGLHCSLGHGLALGGLFAEQAMTAMDAGPALEERMVHDAMHYLILHEIGHTLGLNHNMKATQLLSPDEAFDPGVMESGLIAGSVMDYPAINFAPPGVEQTLFYSVAPGPYDDWAIEFGYSPDMDDPQPREALLARSTEHAVAFGNDADDMRSPGKGIDPRVNIYDMSNDPVSYAGQRLELVDAVLADLRQKYGVQGESYQGLYDGYLSVVTEFQNSANTLSRFVGGVYVNRAMVGQPGAQTPFVPVDEDDQRRAMQLLASRVFAPDAFEASADLYSHLRQQRRGFDFYSVTEDPKLHDLVLAVHKGILDHLMSPVVQKRITDSRLYGNEYGLTAVMDDLTDAIFKADLRTSVSTMRQNLQMEYVNRLLAMVAPETRSGYDYVAQSAALRSLERIQEMLGDHRGRSDETQAHRRNVLYTIRRGLETQA